MLSYFMPIECRIKQTNQRIQTKINKYIPLTTIAIAQTEVLACQILYKMNNE